MYISTKRLIYGTEVPHGYQGWFGVEVVRHLPVSISVVAITLHPIATPIPRQPLVNEFPWSRWLRRRFFIGTWCRGAAYKHETGRSR
jgi:hypothetical protein